MLVAIRGGRQGVEIRGHALRTEVNVTHQVALTAILDMMYAERVERLG